MLLDKKKAGLILAITLMMSSLAQVPSITSFLPKSGPVGTSLVISGSNFNTTPSSNIVHFGATKATVSGASANSLTVTVPFGATFEKISVTANNLTGYSSNRFVVTFSYCNMQPEVNPDSWAPAVTFTTSASGQATAAAIADFDGDGKTDIVVTGTNTASVFRNIHTSPAISLSSFATKVDFTAGNQITNVKTGDIDGDGKIDILILNGAGTSPSITILRNTSTTGNITTSSFAAPLNITLTHTGYVVDADIEDIDGDGKADIAMANGTNFVVVLRNTGVPGSISFATDVTFPLSSVSNCIAVEDIDGNGNKDLVVTEYKKFQVLQGTSTSGAISFGSIATFQLDSPCAKPFGIADFDLDGKLDFISRSGFNGLESFRNVSTAGTINASTFATAVKPTVSDYPTEPVAVADITGDGKPDLVCYSSVYVNNMSGPGPFTPTSFSTRMTINGLNNNYAIGSMVGDINNDGLPDLINYSPMGVDVMRRYAGHPVPTPSICMVTVDSLSINNEIYWDKSMYPSMDSMIIYREVTSNVYKRIDAVSKNALSMYTDTVRSIGPANGNPNVGTYRYKIQLRDTCGNYSDFSLWHNTVFFINSSGTFFWNEYKIEGTPTPTNPMTQFDLVRDDYAPTGNYNTVGTVAGTQTTLNDPLYAAYQNTADWRVFAYGLNCTATQRHGNNGSQAAIVKSRSNVKNNRAQGIKTNAALTGVSFYPNPANDEITIKISKDCSNCSMEISNSLGQNVKTEKLSSIENKVSTSSLANGVYCVKIKNDKNAQFVQKLVIQH
ncbi:MAG: FG-GAP-like repeat-containing protein [Bacteroidia bacterium]